MAVPPPNDNDKQRYLRALDKIVSTDQISLAKLREQLNDCGAMGYFNDEEDNFIFILNDGSKIFHSKFLERERKANQLRSDVEHAKLKLLTGDAAFAFERAMAKRALNPRAPHPTAQRLMQQYILHQIPRRFSVKNPLPQGEGHHKKRRRTKREIEILEQKIYGAYGEYYDKHDGNIFKFLGKHSKKMFGEEMSAGQIQGIYNRFKAKKIDT